jgi:hypothetical protein
MFRNSLKARQVGLVAIERARARQRSRTPWIKKGDANTWYFHLCANIRKRKKHILALQVGDDTVTEQDRKLEAVYSFFC